MHATIVVPKPKCEAEKKFIQTSRLQLQKEKYNTIIQQHTPAHDMAAAVPTARRPPTTACTKKRKLNDSLR